MISCQLETFSSPPKELGLLRDLIGQILPTKQDQDKLLDNSTKSTRVQKSYLQQEQNDSPESPGPQQSTPRLASPPPTATCPVGSSQHRQRPQDSLVDLQPTYLKYTKTESQNSTRKQVDHFNTLASASSRRPLTHILSRRTLPRPGSLINHPITYPRRTGRQLGNVPKGIINTLLRFINPESIWIATKEKKYPTLQSKHLKSKYQKSMNRHTY